MSLPRERVDRWPDRLDVVVATSGGRLRDVTVVQETGSTQDAARRAGAGPGDVIVAVRQTAGRGRLGRTWVDTEGAGVAMTIAWPTPASQRLAMATVIGVARAIERWRDEPVGIKWPNDVLVDGRKLAGVLVEQTGAVALIGVGVNVGQTAWPESLAERAVSLRGLGVDVDRIEVMEALLTEIPTVLELPAEELVQAFALRDVLIGTTGRFRSGDRVVRGRVVRTDPFGGITVAAEDGEVRLETATCLGESPDGCPGPVL